MRVVHHDTGQERTNSIPLCHRILPLLSNFIPPRWLQRVPPSKGETPIRVSASCARRSSEAHGRDIFPSGDERTVQTKPLRSTSVRIQQVSARNQRVEKNADRRGPHEGRACAAGAPYARGEEKDTYLVMLDTGSAHPEKGGKTYGLQTQGRQAAKRAWGVLDLGRLRR